MFPCGALFFCVFDEMFIQVPEFHETSPVLNNFWLRARTQLLFFSENASS